MKKVLFFSCCVLLLMCCGFTAGSDNGYKNGYVDGAYTYRDGYWYYGSQAYTRALEPYQYYYNGCYYTQYRYRYYEYTPPVAAPAVLPSPRDPEWRSKLLDIAAARDKVDGEMRKAALENALYLESVAVLGLQNNFRLQNYGQTTVYPSASYSANYNLGSFGVNGQSIYGQNYDSIASFYGPSYTAELYQMASRHTLNAQALAGQGASEFSGLIDKEGTYRARVAETLARGQAAAQALQAAEGNSVQIQQKSSTFGGTPVMPSADQGAVDPQPSPVYSRVLPPVKILPPAQQPSPVNAAQIVAAEKKFLQATITKRCVMCHKGEPNALTKLDIRNYFKLSNNAKVAIRERLITENLEMRMPRSADGKAAPALTSREIALFEKY